MLVLLAASRAVTVSRFEPGCSAMPVTLHVPVPAAVPLAPLLLVHVTCVTATLSVAVPPSVNVPLVVLYATPLVGDVIVTAGGVVSGPAGVYVTSRVSTALLPA